MKKILEKIKEFDNIIILGHINPDGDCIGSQYGLYYILKESFKDKNIYISGKNSERFSFIGSPKILDDDSIFSNALVIAVDTASKDRLSDSRIDLAKYSIKIDHHHNYAEYADYEYIDSSAISTTQIISEFCINFKDELVVNKLAAEALYVGLVTDSGNFRYKSVTSKTFSMASFLLNYEIDLGYIDEMLSRESLDFLHFKGQLLNNIAMNDLGLAYLVIKRKDLEENNVSFEEAGSLVSLMANIFGIKIWVLFLESEEYIRVRIRSKNIDISTVAEKYGGGGHKFASGAMISSWNQVDDIIKDINELLK